MAVVFVIGRAGSGKTQRCFRAIADAVKSEPLGRPIYWLVPQQATFQAERMLTCQSGLGGFCRVRIVSFEQLANDMLEECGGAVVPAITRLGRQMILGHLLRRHEKQLWFFDRVAGQPGLAARLEATICEFERCGKDPQQIEQLALDLGGDAPLSNGNRPGSVNPLAAKLHDLHLIYQAYCQYLGQEWLDPRRHLEQVLERIARSRRLAGADIYVDGFADFDEFERRVLAGLASVCGKMEIMLLMDPDSPLLTNPHQPPHELSLFYRLEDNYHRLFKAFADHAVQVMPPLLLRQIGRFANPALADIERRLFDPAMAVHHGTVMGIDLVEAPDRRAEAHHAARRIRQLLAEGLRLGDIAVLVRQLDLYQDVIAAAFAEHDIPYFIDRRRTMAHHPLLRFMRAVLAIARDNWPHDAVMTVIKSGLAGLEPHQADQLENYVLEHRLRGAVWARKESWTWSGSTPAPGIAGGDGVGVPPNPTGVPDTKVGAIDGSADAVFPASPMPATEDMPPDPSGGIDALRCAIRDAIGDFPQQLAADVGQPTVRAVVVAIFQLFDRFGIRRTLGQWIGQSRQHQQYEEAGEHEQVWSELVSLFDQMVSLLGDQAVDMPAFCGILEGALETFDLALAPATLDQVLVGQVDRSRTPQIKAMLLLGVNDGVFPHAAQENSILSDVERQELRDHQFDVEMGTERLLLDENLLGYIALTRASRSLYVSRSIADDAGRKLGPSPFWRRLQQCYPQLPVLQLPQDERINPSLISTPRQLVTALMRWASQRGRTEADAAREGNGNKPVQKSTKTLTPPSSGAPAEGSATTAAPGDDPASLAFASLYQWLANHPCNDDAVDQMRHRAWSALGYANKASLSPPLAGQLFAAPLSVGVAQLEAHAACPFQHFVRYGLGLRQRSQSDTIAINLDQAFHEILEDLVRKMLQQRLNWDQLDPDMARQLLDTFARKAAQNLRGEMMLSNARNRYLLGRIQRILQQVIDAQKVAANHGAFRTLRGQVAFGFEDAALPALQLITPHGHTVQICGRIDRVDMLHLEHQAAFAVFDYRLGDNKLSLARVSHGLQLQLLTSLLVMSEHGGRLTGSGNQLSPAAAFYVRLLRQLESVKHPDDAPKEDENRLSPWFKRRGILDSQFLPDLDDTPAGHCQVVSAYRTKDGAMGMKNVTDVVEREELQRLLDMVRQKLAELADQIIDGRIDITPYRMGKFTACPQCWHRSVCRFEVGINQYRHLNTASRTDVLGGQPEGESDE